ncbi:MAG: DEAD/DEAH box helicase [Lachnospiraceae bacterium]|nr:DEAD/DEAH box helicase [Lachnospiraceae bacterium]
MRYDESFIDSRIVRAVTEMGFETMTPIQEQAIPYLLEGRDIIGQAQTGTGKTAAFGIPLLQKIDPDDRSLQAVVLCPTRELAIQASEEMRKFAKYMHGIRMVPIYGGQDITRQIKALKGGVQVIVGTPGRVMDHMRRHTIKMDTVKMVVLDEADEMLNMGFREDMETILKEVPGEHQTALFSATMPQAILDITGTYQHDAVTVKVAAKELTVPLVKQFYFYVKNIYKEEVISRLLEVHGLKRSMIFCNTKKMVDELAENLKARGYQAEGLHGDLTQKQRDFVMNRFRSGNLEILIATDVAARGIDVDDVEAVFNYDIPQDIEYYVHRIGRTGRAGREGMAFTFAYGRDMYKLRDIERVCKTKMTESQVPSAKQVNRMKAEKVLKNAVLLTLDNQLEKLEEMLEEYVTEHELDPMQLVAALVKMQVGEPLREIEIEQPRAQRHKSSDGENRSSRGRGGDRSGEGRESRRGGDRDRKPERGGKRQEEQGRRRRGKLGVREYTPEKDRGGRKKNRTEKYKAEKYEKFTKMPKDVRRNGKRADAR